MSDSAAKEPSKKEETSPSLSSLPDEVALSCLARVPRSDHAALSLVSKRYRSLVVSPEFYKTRSLMGRTEECLYVCLSSKPYSTPLSFILRRENKTSAAEKTVNRLIPIPSFPSQPHKFSSFVTIDWGIYVIGGFINGNRTSSVSLLDCRTNTWHKVTSMAVGRAAAAAGVVNGKIYVFGGCEEVDSSNWAEVFDPKTQTWDTLVPMTDRNEGDNWIRETLVMEEKVYAVDKWIRCFYYSPREGKWGRKKKPEIQRHCCVIEKLLYGCNEYGEVFWSDSEKFEWKKVKGLQFLDRICKRFWNLSNFGANIVVFSTTPRGYVWGDEISLERREEEGEIWGTIETSEVVARLDHAHFSRDAVEVLYLATVNV